MNSALRTPRRFQPSREGVHVTSDGIMTTMLPISVLELGIFTPRRAIDQSYVKELAEDLQREGQFKPIIVRPHPTQPDRYQVIDGEHRVRALENIHNLSVRAEVRQLSDLSATSLALKVNMIHGLRLTELDEAYQIKRFRDEFDKTEEEIGKIFNRTHAWVSQRLSLVEKASEGVQEALVTRVTTPVHARELVKLQKDQQDKVLHIVKKETLSTRQTKKLVDTVKGKPGELDRLSSLPKDDLLSELEGKALLHTDEDVDQFYDETEREEPTLTERCPGCGRTVRIDWMAREVTWG